MCLPGDERLFWTRKMKVYQNESTLGTEKNKTKKVGQKTETEITIKWLGSAEKVRVGRVTGNRHIFYFGLIYSFIFDTLGPNSLQCALIHSEPYVIPG